MSVRTLHTYTHIQIFILVDRCPLSLRVHNADESRLFSGSRDPSIRFPNAVHIYIFLEIVSLLPFDSFIFFLQEKLCQLKRRDNLWSDAADT
jgi:hypothetical protein